MICLLALPILAILGIFSATHRRLATEAFDCVFRRLTLRKCEAKLDTRLKSSITSTVMRRSPAAAGWIFKNFELLSWMFLILMIGSTFYSAYGVYNYVAFGNCNGEKSNEFCVFKTLEPTKTSCEVQPCNETPCECNETCTPETCPNDCKLKKGS